MKYYKNRYFDSDVHVVEFDPKVSASQLCLGKPGREPLSAIGHEWFTNQGYVIRAKVNLGFFDFTLPVEHYGLAMHDNGFSQGNPEAVNGICCYLGLDNKFVVRDILMAEVAQLRDQVYWGGSLSYALVIDGKKNLAKQEFYDFRNLRCPRTMVGQTADGTMVLAVADGSTKWDVGLNADQSADVMLALGCVNAINADGGGSSEVIIDGVIKNTPTDGGERTIGSALLVFEKPEPTPAPMQLTRVYFGGSIYERALFEDKAHAYTFGWTLYNAGHKDVYLKEPDDTRYTFDVHPSDNPTKPAVYHYQVQTDRITDRAVANQIMEDLQTKYKLVSTLLLSEG